MLRSQWIALKYCMHIRSAITAIAELVVLNASSLHNDRAGVWETEVLFLAPRHVVNVAPRNSKCFPRVCTAADLLDIWNTGIDILSILKSNIDPSLLFTGLDILRKFNSRWKAETMNLSNSIQVSMAFKTLFAWLIMPAWRAEDAKSLRRFCSNFSRDLSRNKKTAHVWDRGLLSQE